MRPISIDDFIKMMKLDSKEEEIALRKSVLEAVNKKKNNAKCIKCGETIWAIGTGIIGKNCCSACLIKDQNDQEDYEIDEVCY